MTNRDDITIHDCLAGAFQALLRGDTGQRDVLCAMAEREFQRQGSQSLPADTVIQLKDCTHD